MRILLRAVEFREVLKRRRMVRAYERESIPRATLERIVATRWRRAPSAGFSQGQRFIVVTESERKRSIADATGEEDYVGEGFSPWISGAAALVVFCTREDDHHDRYRQPDKVDDEGAEIEWRVPYWHVDAGKTAMLVLLAAIDEVSRRASSAFPLSGWTASASSSDFHPTLRSSK